MSNLSILQDNESKYSNWALSSYSMAWRPFTSLVEHLWMSSSSLMSFLSHGRRAWNEYSKWEHTKVRNNLSKSVGVIFMPLCDALMAPIIEFAFFAAFGHWWWGLNVSSTITPKSRCWLTLLRGPPFRWYWTFLSFAYGGCSLRTTHLSVWQLMRAPWDQLDI